ncbi:MAG: PAS domain-containing protein [Sphingomonas sp.]|uniref:sensor histidine kinase n=1 Tax=unclassified Sphingomonas TaxID=196159 RepID=UPI0024538815|nr:MULTISPECIES: ATP-binding protein [unclassified Sphingomonas]MBQ1496934.1 PAS domain-containing protein [Sphingomonas sp.]MDH4743993.1 ATP-binding protein [Sphingomonas sp. CBMAI 2297]
MNVIDPTLPLSIARLDAEGRLIDAEARLFELNMRAGGMIGAPLAVPQIATLARLSQRLGIAISRNVIAADGEDDLELWVRAEPEQGGVRLEVSGWRLRPGWRAPAGEPERDGDFFRSAADWLWETDASLRITFLSIEAGARYGFDSSMMLGQPLTRLFRLEQDEAGELPILSAVAAQGRFDGQKAELRGTGRMVRLAATPRADPGGRFAGFVGAAHMLDQAMPAAPKVDAPVPAAAVPFGGFPDSFSQRLDRALRGPLGKIIANADSISAQTEGPLKPDYAEYASDIANAGRHLLGLVDDLVDLQAIERDDFGTADEEIDLADVARRAAGLLAVRAAQAEVRIDRPSMDESIPVRGEFRRALQVLVNLIGNAVRYSPQGGMVWIRLERDEARGHVIVADQGKGIAHADQEKIFEKFGRVDPSEPGGSGLGLYIARRLARAMGGDLVVDSAPGQGARFVFSMPIRQ